MHNAHRLKPVAYVVHKLNKEYDDSIISNGVVYDFSGLLEDTPMQTKKCPACLVNSNAPTCPCCGCCMTTPLPQEEKDPREKIIYL